MLDKTLIKKILDAALSTAADFAEVFIEDKFATNATLLSSKVESVRQLSALIPIILSHWPTATVKSVSVPSGQIPW